MSPTLVDKKGNPLYTNRLIDEDSPYLMQHAHNPVNWYPWGDEAFVMARQDNKPVFLSIGYSTCHWCHVMEHESFDNEEIAAFLNEHFVSIKLDREQRPDLDDVYMTGVQIISGQGGWPMSNFLTHDAHPFFAGTYYPPQRFLDLLRQLSEVWKEKRGDVEKQAGEIAAAIGRYTSAANDVARLDSDLTRRAASELIARHDTTDGGFGGAPKFPNESQLLVLLDDCRRNQSQDSANTLRLTLDKMYQGGIYDQIAGGFHRYSVDAQWLVPHFEKMLYNQAQLLTVYTQAWCFTGDIAYHRIATEIGDYVLRDMLAPSGGFYSATDADSEGVEGRFFVWQFEELKEILDPGQFSLLQDVFGVSETGNFEGANILNLQTSLERYAVSHGLVIDDLLRSLSEIKQRLYLRREERIHPLRDEKIISAWNGMMISALAVAGHELQIPRFLDAANNAADRIWDVHFADKHDQPLLWRVSLRGHTSIPGCLEDYACMAEALLRLYFYEPQSEKMDRGLKLLEVMNVEFQDESAGGYFMSARETAGPMMIRPKSPADGAAPSANAVALHVLSMAYQITGDLHFKRRADETITAFSGLIQASPSSFSTMIRAISDLTHGSLANVQFAASGKIRVTLTRKANKVELAIDIADEWHINSNEVDAEELIPTEIVSSDDINRIDYPPGTTANYAGNVTIRVEVATLQYCQLQLRLQACSGDLCLAPETLTLGC